MELKLKKLNKFFGDKKAVSEVDLNIKQGEIFTILGASGSGKTTVLRTIAGFETPTSGTIQFGNKIMSDNKTFITPEKRSVGLVFQDLALFPHMSVEKNILFAMGDRSGKKELNELLDLCKLNGLNKRYPHEISGGEMQRVALARAIAGSPDILLLDEPFNNLDVLLKESLLRDVKRIIKARGITAMFVTHHKDEAYYLSDRIAIMKNGEIQQVGTPISLYKNPVSKYTASFLGKTNLLTKNGKEGWIRPEDITISTDGITNGFIVDTCFQGHHIEITIRMENNSYEQDYITAHSTDLSLKIGDQIKYSFNWRPFKAVEN